MQDYAVEHQQHLTNMDARRQLEQVKQQVLKNKKQRLISIDMKSRKRRDSSIVLEQPVVGIAPGDRPDA